MRDAFGSTFMFKLIIIFIVFYVSFMTIAVSYAKVFKIKNGLIDILEQSQFDYSSETDWNQVVLENMDTYLENFAYRYYDNTKIQNDCNNQDGRLSHNGACIVSYPVGDDSAYYRVVVYLVISFPLFSSDFVIPIPGETKTIRIKAVMS